MAGIGSDHVKLSELADIWKADKLFKSKKSEQLPHSYLGVVEISVDPVLASHRDGAQPEEVQD